MYTKFANMDFGLTLIAILVSVFVIFYFYLKQKYSYWSNQGVPGPTPSLLKFGTIVGQFSRSPSEFESDWAAKYGKVYGLFNGFRPVLTIADADLIKQVLVKDFHLLVNRFDLQTYHEVVNLNLFFAESEQWKRIRTIVSPTFTSGKLHSMHKLMNKCVDKLMDYFDRLSTETNGVMDTKEVISGFTIDVIALTAFATETNSNDDRNKKSPFVENGIGLFKFTWWRAICFLAMPAAFNNFIGIKHGFNPDNLNFFVDLSKAILKERKNSTVKRNDFVQLLMDAFVYEDDLKGTNYDKLYDAQSTEAHHSPISNKTKRTLTDNEIIAQCFVFFVAGFETTASTISNVIYELAMNQDVQDRLFDEVTDKLAELDPNSKEYYETTMTEIPYLEAVIKETLRKYAPVIRLTRCVGVDEYKIAGIVLKKNQIISVPTVAVHYNPEYHPDPERFNPERFMPENKHLLVPYSFIPFGQGPRNCIGMRFAYQEIKLCVANVVQKFKFFPTPDTPEKLQFRPFTPTLNVLPFPIKVEKR